MRKSARKKRTTHKIAPSQMLRYPRGTMGRPPMPPRSYVTRHVRFRRPLDAAMRRAALRERRGFNDLLQIIVEDWLRAHGELGDEPLVPPRPRQPRKPTR
jgi:hypothetical protein